MTRSAATIACTVEGAIMPSWGEYPDGSSVAAATPSSTPLARECQGATYTTTPGESARSGYATRQRTRDRARRSPMARTMPVQSRSMGGRAGQSCGGSDAFGLFSVTL